MKRSQLKQITIFTYIVSIIYIVTGFRKPINFLYYFRVGRPFHVHRVKVNQKCCFKCHFVFNLLFPNVLDAVLLHISTRSCVQNINNSLIFIITFEDKKFYNAIKNSVCLKTFFIVTQIFSFRTYLLLTLCV